jgi:Protein of unknown function (DUF4235)
MFTAFAADVNGYGGPAMKLIYRPIGYICGFVAGLVAKRIFDFIWAKIDKEDPPEGTTQYAPWAKVVGAAALQGMIFKSTRVIVDRYGAIGWHYLTGAWPGK